MKGKFGGIAISEGARIGGLGRSGHRFTKCEREEANWIKRFEELKR
ncbi:conserved hypothetical protein [delta proteobacterium NaphS2]|nr:conserved hypothetical protein [delta proteobacterium NaphS2]